MAHDPHWRHAPTTMTGLVRRTTIELGPLRITREVALSTLPALVRPRRRLWPALLAVTAATSVGGLAVAATRLPPRASYSVSVPVPERVTAPAPPATPAPRAVRHAAPAPRASPSPADEAAAEMLPAPSLPAPATRAAAVAAALRSGAMTEWQQPGGAHGFVVAGAAEPDGARTCRALSVLTRDIGGDRVEQLRACVAGDGAAG